MQLSSVFVLFRWFFSGYRTQSVVISDQGVRLWVLCDGVLSFGLVEASVCKSVPTGPTWSSEQRGHTEVNDTEGLRTSPRPFGQDLQRFSSTLSQKSNQSA